MHIDSKIEKDGVRWFFIAGGCAVVLSIFLYMVDEGLTNSNREQKLAETLRELRTAQASVAAGSIDPRTKSSSGLVTVKVAGE